ncbi:hypothetical protein ACH5RR_039079 [Cinchona calisaya]|uniref:Reverse transcriptase domain-containing protein n=1 Tax=Cinchona calisaya TaxID=153742 RepID=A0ABD2XX63_9GENT
MTHGNRLPISVNKISEVPPYRSTPILSDEDFTPHNIPIREILYQVRNSRIIAPLPPIRSQFHWRDRSKYCAHHGDHGHDMDECNDLKFEIERVVKNRHLQEHILREADQFRRNEKKPVVGEGPSQITYRT